MRQTDLPRGIVHVHTTISHDGFLDISQIAALCRERGLAFAAISDHAEDVTPSNFAALIRACDQYSGSGFVLIPGIEHRFHDGIHVLALGQKRLVSGNSIDKFKALSSDGCVLVAAHCILHDDLPARLLEIMSLVEIWNVSRHTRYLPASGCFAVYRQWASVYPNLYAIGGLDMHIGKEWGCEVELDCNCERSANAVLDALRTGHFATKGRFISFDSRPDGGIRGLAFVAGNALVGVRDARNRMLYRS